MLLENIVEALGTKVIAGTYCYITMGIKVITGIHCNDRNRGRLVVHCYNNEKRGHCYIATVTLDTFV
jgi:hypothetical protein